VCGRAAVTHIFNADGFSGSWSPVLELTDVELDGRIDDLPLLILQRKWIEGCSVLVGTGTYSVRYTQ
jgi:hypothetical protein